MGHRTRKGVRVLACRSIEPEQSLGPWSKPVCARMGSDGRVMVGVDVSKDRLDVAVRPTGEGCVFKRDESYAALKL
jgi:hypothetical protein